MPRTRPLELTRSGILGTVAVFVIVVACVRLGLWQLDRRDQRLERNEAVAARLAADPVVLDGAPADTGGLTYRRATLRGRFDDDRAVVLAGRSYNGTPGTHVLSPLRLGDGAVLVNRGWVPAADGATIELDPIRLAGGARVEGVLLPFPDVDLDREPGGAFQRTWYRLDSDAIREQYPYPVSSLYLLATSRPEAPGADTAGFPVILDAPTLDAGPHLSYAVQWFSFALIFLVGWMALLARGDGAPRPDPEPARPGAIG